MLEPSPERCTIVLIPLQGSENKKHWSWQVYSLPSAKMFHHDSKTGANDVESAYMRDVFSAAIGTAIESFEMHGWPQQQAEYQSGEFTCIGMLRFIELRLLSTAGTIQKPLSATELDVRNARAGLIALWEGTRATYERNDRQVVAVS